MQDKEINSEINQEKNIDIYALGEIEKICFPTSFYSLSMLEEIEKNSSYHITIIESEGDIVGYSIVMDNSEEMEILKIATLPEHRRQGIGKILLEKIEELGKNIYLEVREKNVVAQNFYRSCGFKNVGLRKNYYSNPTDNAVVMLKEIMK